MNDGHVQGCIRRGAGGEGGGEFWNPTVCGPKIAQIKILLFGNFIISHYEILVQGGGGGV